MLFMGLVYIGFIWLCASFVWGRSAEEAYESQKYDFWTKMLGRRRSILLSRVLGLLGMIAISLTYLIIFLF